MTRQEHLEWCKQRATEYLESGDAKGALASMLSDLSKHPETKGHADIQLAGMLLISGMLETTKDVHKFIEDFN